MRLKRSNEKWISDYRPNRSKWPIFRLAWFILCVVVVDVCVCHCRKSDFVQQIKFIVIKIKYRIQCAHPLCNTPRTVCDDRSRQSERVSSSWPTSESGRETGLSWNLSNLHTFTLGSVSVCHLSPLSQARHSGSSHIFRIAHSIITIDLHILAQFCAMRNFGVSVLFARCFCPVPLSLSSSSDVFQSFSLASLYSKCTIRIKLSCDTHVSVTVVLHEWLSNYLSNVYARARANNQVPCFLLLLLFLSFTPPHLCHALSLSPNILFTCWNSAVCFLQWNSLIYLSTGK